MECQGIIQVQVHVRVYLYPKVCDALKNMHYIQTPQALETPGTLGTLQTPTALGTPQALKTLGTPLALGTPMALGTTDTNSTRHYRHQRH